MIVIDNKDLKITASRSRARKRGDINIFNSITQTSYNDSEFDIIGYSITLKRIEKSDEVEFIKKAFEDISSGDPDSSNLRIIKLEMDVIDENIIPYAIKYFKDDINICVDCMNIKIEAKPSIGLIKVSEDGVYTQIEMYTFNDKMNINDVVSKIDSIKDKYENDLTTVRYSNMEIDVMNTFVQKIESLDKGGFSWVMTAKLEVL